MTGFAIGNVWTQYFTNFHETLRKTYDRVGQRYCTIPTLTIRIRSGEKVQSPHQSLFAPLTAPQHFHSNSFNFLRSHNRSRLKFFNRTYSPRLKFFNRSHERDRSNEKSPQEPRVATVRTDPGPIVRSRLRAVQSHN